MKLKKGLIISLLLLVSFLPAAAWALDVSPGTGVSGEPGESITVPVMIDDLGAGLEVDAIGLTLNFDPNVLQYVSVDKSGTLLEPFMFLDGNENTAGALKISGALFGSTVNIASSGVLFNVNFSVLPTAIANSTLSITEIVDDIADATTTDTIFTIGGISIEVVLTADPTGSIVAGDAVDLTAVVQVNGTGMDLTSVDDITFATSGSGSFGEKTLAGGAVTVTYTTAQLVESATIIATEQVTVGGNDDSLVITSVAGTATNLSPVSGSGQAGTVGTDLAEDFVAELTDQYGNPVVGEAIAFVVSSGGDASLSQTSVNTGADGRATTRLTLATLVGTNEVTASYASLDPVVFTATGNAGPLAGLAIFPSGAVSLTADETQTFTAAGRDAYGNAVDAIATITWSGGQGIGTIDPSTGEFDATTVGTGTVVATSSIGGVSGESGTITVTHGAAAGLVLASDRDSVASEGNSSANLEATLLDIDSNVISTDNTTQVTFTVAGDGVANAAWTDETVTVVNGVATIAFTTVGVAPEGGTSVSISVSAGAFNAGPVNLNIVNFSLQPPAAGILLGDTLALEVSGATGTVSWSVTSPDVGALGSFSGDFGGTTRAVFTANAVGSTMIIVSDPAVAGIEFGPFEVVDEVELSAEGDSSELGDDGTLELSVAGGNGEYTWTVAGPLAVPGAEGVASYTFVAPDEGAFAGEYTVTVNDGYGFTDSFVIYVPLNFEQSHYSVLEGQAVDPALFTLKGFAADLTADGIDVVLLDGEGNGVTDEEGNPLIFDNPGAPTDYGVLNPDVADSLALFDYTGQVVDDDEMRIFMVQFGVEGLEPVTSDPITIIPVVEHTVSVFNETGAAVEDGVMVLVLADGLEIASGETVDGAVTFLLPMYGCYEYRTVPDETYFAAIESSCAQSVEIVLLDKATASTFTILSVTDTDSGASLLGDSGLSVYALLPPDYDVQYEMQDVGPESYQIQVPDATGYTVIAEMEGYLAQVLTDQTPPGELTFSLEEITGTIITSVTAKAQADMVVVAVTAYPEFSDAGQLTIEQLAGEGSLSPAALDDGSIVFAYSPAGDFTIAITPAGGDTFNFSYAAGEDKIQSAVDVTGGEIYFDADAWVVVPEGGVNEPVVVTIQEVEMDSSDPGADAAGGSGGVIYEIDVAPFDGSGSDIVNRLIITLPIDLSVVKPGALQSGEMKIYFCEDKIFFGDGNYTDAVPVENIIAVDYLGDGKTGSVTFWVDHLTVFGVGSASALSTSGDGSGTTTTSSGGSSTCFIGAAGGPSGTFLWWLLTGAIVLGTCLLSSAAKKR